MKYSNKPRHFARKPQAPKAQNKPGHRSSGRGKNVITHDPFELLVKLIPGLRKFRTLKQDLSTRPK